MNNAGTFSTPGFLGNHGNFGGGKPTPPTVPPMWHAGPLASAERKSPCHCTVRQGGGAEERVLSGGGSEGELGEGLSGLWRTFGKCDGVQVYRNVGDGR